MIRVENLSFTYAESNIPALSHIDLEIKEGEFVVIVGRNGSGKSTLIKALLGIIPNEVLGNFQGRISLFEQPIVDTLSLASKVGVLLQNPDSQITNLTVWEEVAFGLENLCFPVDQVLERTSFALNQMKMNKISEQSTHQLSGGQKQRLSLSALLAMKPQVLVMDEPLANLDNEGIDSVIKSLANIHPKVNTIVVSSHILEPFLSLMTRVVVMDKGKVVSDFPANRIGEYRSELISNAVELPNQQPPLIPMTKPENGSKLIKLSHVAYSYPNNVKPLTDVNFDIYQGEKVTLIGANGAGKSTLARLLVGLRKPKFGVIESYIRHPKLVPQDANLSFMEASIIDELSSQNISEHLIKKVLEQCSLGRDSHRSPFKLSGGQQRLLAIASAIATNPDFIVIDEPTAGLDADHVRQIFQMTSGIESVFHITHDHRVIFHSSRVIILQNGEIVERGGEL